jgi:hypothetical protein
MWEKPTRYAVMKNKNKRATRVLDTELEAGTICASLSEKHPKEKYFVNERKGERTRCEGYCPVSFYCNQYAEYIGMEEE